MSSVSYVVPGIELGLAKCKGNVLLLVLSLQLQAILHDLKPILGSHEWFFCHQHKFGIRKTAANR